MSQDNKVARLPTVTGMNGLLNQLHVNQGKPHVMAEELLCFIRESDYGKFTTFAQLVDPQILREYMTIPQVKNAYRARLLEIMKGMTTLIELDLAMS